MKRFLLTLLIMCVLSSSTLASQIEDKINDAITLYKSGNYSECIKNLNTIISQDSTYPITYYYLGLSYAKTNKKNLAIENYNKVIELSSDKSLKSMAKAAKDCLGTSGFTALDAQLSISNSSKAEKFISEKYTQSSKNNTDKESKNVAQEPKKTIKNEKLPTNTEIGEAIMVLKRAGLWNGALPTQNPSEIATTSNDTKKQENDFAKMYMQQMMQQMNNPAYLMMSMNGNNNNNGMGGMNMMNLLPFLMNNSSDEKTNPTVNQQFLQTMMMSQMMPNLDFSSFDSK